MKSLLNGSGVSRATISCISRSLRSFGWPSISANISLAVAYGPGDTSSLLTTVKRLSAWPKLEKEEQKVVSVMIRRNKGFMKKCFSPAGTYRLRGRYTVRLEIDENGHVGNLSTSKLGSEQLALGLGGGYIEHNSKKMLKCLQRIIKNLSWPRTSSKRLIAFPLRVHDPLNRFEIGEINKHTNYWAQSCFLTKGNAKQIVVRVRKNGTGIVKGKGHFRNCMQEYFREQQLPFLESSQRLNLRYVHRPPTLRPTTRSGFGPGGTRGVSLGTIR